MDNMKQFNVHAVAQALEEEGILSSLRAQLKANIFRVFLGPLSTGHVADSLPLLKPNHELLQSNEGVLCSAFVLDYLLQTNLLHTRDVFMTEASLDAASGVKILQELGFSASGQEPALLKLLRAYWHGNDLPAHSVSQPQRKGDEGEEQQGGAPAQRSVAGRGPEDSSDVWAWRSHCTSEACTACTARAVASHAAAAEPARTTPSSAACTGCTASTSAGGQVWASSMGGGQERPPVAWQSCESGPGPAPQQATLEPSDSLHEEDGAPMSPLPMGLGPTSPRGPTHQAPCPTSHRESDIPSCEEPGPENHREPGPASHSERGPSVHMEPGPTSHRVPGSTSHKVPGPTSHRGLSPTNEREPERPNSHKVPGPPSHRGPHPQRTEECGVTSQRIPSMVSNVEGGESLRLPGPARKRVPGLPSMRGPGPASPPPGALWAVPEWGQKQPLRGSGLTATGSPWMEARPPSDPFQLCKATLSTHPCKENLPPSGAVGLPALEALPAGDSVRERTSQSFGSPCMRPLSSTVNRALGCPGSEALPAADSVKGCTSQSFGSPCMSPISPSGALGRPGLEALPAADSSMLQGAEVSMARASISDVRAQEMADWLQDDEASTDTDIEVYGSKDLDDAAAAAIVRSQFSHPHYLHDFGAWLSPLDGQPSSSPRSLSWGYLDDLDWP
eukprot:jgi/Botrbrau1/3852/Bobra.0183s0077.1